MSETKSFPALERCIDFAERFNGMNEVAGEARAELQKAEKLLAALRQLLAYRAHEPFCEVNRTDFCTCGMKDVADNARRLIAACLPPQGVTGSNKEKE